MALLAASYIEQAIETCDDGSVKLALRSIWRDMFLKKGNLSPLVVQPRLRAKKYIFVIGGSKRESVSTWAKSCECTFETVEKFDTFKKYITRLKAISIGRCTGEASIWSVSVFDLGVSVCNIPAGMVKIDNIFPLVLAPAYTVVLRVRSAVFKGSLTFVHCHTLHHYRL